MEGAGARISDASGGASRPSWCLAAPRELKPQVVRGGGQVVAHVWHSGKCVSAPLPLRAVIGCVLSERRCQAAVAGVMHDDMHACVQGTRWTSARAGGSTWTGESLQPRQLCTLRC